MGRKKKAPTAGRQRTSSENRAAMVAIILIVGVLFLALFVKGIHLRSRIVENDIAKEELNTKIEQEKARTDSIASLKDYYESEEYIRQTAKEKLGLIEEGELVFRPKNDG